jgi:hypothetical protein
LRLAVAAYLAWFKGSSREHTKPDLRCYLCLVPSVAWTRWPRRRTWSCLLHGGSGLHRPADLIASRHAARRGIPVTHIDLTKRTDFPATFDERATLTQLLSYLRLTVHAKCAGLSQPDAVRTHCRAHRP